MYFNKTNDVSLSTYYTYQAVYHSKSLESYIISFVRDQRTYVMRINENPDTSFDPPHYSIVWNFEF